MVAPAVPPLLPYLRTISDPRQPAGRPHSLEAVLALVCAAMLAGGVPQGSAVLRNSAIGLLRAHSHAAIAVSRRALAHHGDAAVALLGL